MENQSVKTVHVELEERANVEIQLRHVCGIPIQTLFSGEFEAGEHDIHVELGGIKPYTNSGRDILRYDLLVDGVDKDWWMFKVAS